MLAVRTQSLLSPGFYQRPVNHDKFPDFEFYSRRVSNLKRPALPQIANNTASAEPYCPVKPWNCRTNYPTIGFCPNYLRLPEVADPDAPWLQACYQENQSSPDPEYEIPDIPPLLFKDGDHPTDANRLDPLFCAYARGGTRAIEALLQRAEVDPNACDGEGRTLMHYAVQQHDEATVQLLLDNGACVDGVKGTGLPDTPLHTATRNSLTSMVELLVMANADLDIKGCDGLSPIEIAIKTRHSRIFQVLSENGATLDGQGLSPERKRRIELHASYFKALFLSIADDNWASFQQLLLMVNNINGLNDDDEWESLLAFACESDTDGKHLDYIRDLINKGADVNKADEFGRSPLYAAAENRFNGHAAAELLMAAYGADPNIADEKGRTPLHIASLHRNLKVVERLLAHGANPNAADSSGEGPLVYACRAGDIASIRLLLDRGALLLSNQGWACLDHVHANGVEFVQLLLDHLAGLDSAPDNFASKLLLRACVQGEEQDITAIAQRLIENKADVNIRDTSMGWTPLLYASRFGNVKLVNLLLDRGADINISDEGDGRDALSIAVTHGHSTVVGKLIKHTAFLDRGDHNGRTALIYASSLGHTSIVKQLIRAGASLNSVDQYRANALHYASAGDHTGVMEQLIANGVPLNQGNMYGITPLHMACLYGQSNAVRLLIDKGAALDSQDEEGMTPLYYASADDTRSRKQESRAEVIGLLIRAGADAFKPANDGSTPIDEAEHNAEYDIVRILRDHANSLNKTFNLTLPRQSSSHELKQGRRLLY